LRATAAAALKARSSVSLKMTRTDGVWADRSERIASPNATRHAPRADEDGSDQMRNAFVLRCTDARGQQGAETGATRIDEPAQSVLMPQQSSNS
jgi:hypothetical protein